MSNSLFEDETMGPEHMAKQERVQALLNGNDADYDRYSRSGSFAGGAGFDDQPMRRGSIAGEDSNFLASRPNPGIESSGFGLGFGQAFFEDDDSDAQSERGIVEEGRSPSVRPSSGAVAPSLGLSTIPELESVAEEDSLVGGGVRQRKQGIGSMRRAGAPSLEPMAFGRERAGSTVGWNSAPYTPDIYRNHDEEHTFDLIQDYQKSKNPQVDQRAENAEFLRGRMNRDPDVLALGAGKQAPERAPLTQQEMLEEGDKLDYQHTTRDGRELRNLSPSRDHGYWMSAHPDQPNRGGFMSRPDAGWDRVKSRGFLGIPWLFSMLGSKMFGTKGGRYDKRKADFARRNETFERARETYGSTPEGRQGVTPAWINESDWARDRWAQREDDVNALRPRAAHLNRRAMR